MSFLEALQVNPLLLTAILAGFAASFVSGIVGSYVVVKRIGFVTGSISHTVLGGIGFCLWLDRAQGFYQVPPIAGALVTAVISALLISWIHLFYRQRQDAVIAALWSVGMAVGIIFISNTPGFNIELTNFLIGNILWVSPSDLKVLGALDVVVGGLAFLLHHRLLAICFDEDQAQLQGLSVPWLYTLLLVMTSISIVLLVQVVGIVLVMTMLTLPATIANLFTNRLSRVMFLAIGLSALFCFIGMAIAYELDWPAGATIALVAGASYGLCLGLRRGA